MWMLKRGDEFLPYVSVQRLHRMYDQEKNAKAKLRLLAAIRRKKGESIDTIAAALEKPRRTIHGWLQRFEQRRLQAVHDKKQPGRTPKLDKSQLKSLRRELIRGPAHVPGRLWTVRVLSEHIKKNYGTQYKRHNIIRLLNALGFSVQKPRQQHFKADVRKQVSFKKKRGEYATSTGIVDGRSRVWTSVRSTSHRTSVEAGRSREATLS